jgi:hypothetical protein
MSNNTYICPNFKNEDGFNCNNEIGNCDRADQGFIHMALYKTKTSYQLAKR